MKLSNASGPRTDFVMRESCTVFTDVFCLHCWTCEYKGFFFSPLFSHFGEGVIKRKETGRGVMVILLGNHVVKIALHVLGTANGEGCCWRVRSGGENG